HAVLGSLRGADLIDLHGHVTGFDGGEEFTRGGDRVGPFRGVAVRLGRVFGIDLCGVGLGLLLDRRFGLGGGLFARLAGRGGVRRVIGFVVRTAGCQQQGGDEGGRDGDGGQSRVAPHGTP